jgi:tetratricopeptide (TPR) repeat protein
VFHLVCVIQKPLLFAVVVGLVIAVFASGFRVALNATSRTPESVRRQMHGDLRAGRLANCQAALSWLRRLGGLIAEDWMVRARIEQLQGRTDDALESLKRVDDRDPLAAQARLMTGLIELERFHARAADAALRKAIDPGQAAARLELVQLYSRQQRFAELDAQCSALARRDQLDFEHMRSWCMTKSAAWAPKDDVEILRRYVEAGPDDRWSRLALAEGLRRLGRGDEAQRLLEPLSDLDPEARGASTARAG